MAVKPVHGRFGRWGTSVLIMVVLCLCGQRWLSVGVRGEPAESAASPSESQAVNTASGGAQQTAPGVSLRRHPLSARPQGASPSPETCGEIVQAPAPAPPVQMATLELPGPVAHGSAQAVPTGVPGSNLFLETFEGTFPTGLWGLSGNPTWNDTNFKSFNGAKSAWCAGGGGLARDPATDNYANNMNAWMIYGPFSLVGINGGVFSFNYWLETEASADFLRYFVSTNGVNFHGFSTSGSTNDSWVNTAINLTNVPTLGDVSNQPQVWIALNFFSNPSIGFKGAFVDDVRVDNVVVPDLVAEQVYFRDAPAGGGSIIANPTPGQLVYPHISYRLDGPNPINARTLALDVDGAILCQSAPGTLLNPGSWIGWCPSAYVVPAGEHQLRGTVDPDGTVAEAIESNNQAVMPFGAGPTIDLEAVEVYFRDQPDDLGNFIANPCVGEVVYPHFAFDVTGSGSATGEILSLEIDGTPVCGFVGTVDAGFGYIVNCIEPYTVTAGDHELLGVLDPDDTILEISEINNQAALNTTDCQLPDIRVNPASVTVSCDQDSAAALVAAGAAGAEQKLLHKQDILAQFAQGKTMARVLVALKPPANAPAAVDFNDHRSARRLRDAVRPHQQALLGRLAPADFKLRYQFENQPSLWMEVTQAGLARLQNDPAVQVIAPVREVPMHLAQGLPLMDALTYRLTYGGQGVAVAICDTGVDYNHPRLGGGGFPNAKVIGGFDTGDNDANPFPSGGEAHGTACAGIAAGDTGTVGDYIGGVAPQAKIYALKITPDVTPGMSSDAAIAAAWDWCVTHRNDDPTHPILVISTSFGGDQHLATCDGDSPVLTAAAANAVAAGMTLPVSSGNDGFCNAISSPACITSVISVGAVYDADFGNISPCVSAASCVTKFPTGGCATGWFTTDASAPDLVTSYSNSASFLAALGPSNSCNTTDIVGGGGYSGSDYATGFGGTSAACPYVAGGIAALQSAAKARIGSFLTPAQVRQILTTTGDSVVDPKNMIAKPRINLANAIDSIIPPSPDCVTIFNDGSTPLNVTSVTTPPWATLNPPPPYTILPGASQTVCVEACGSCAGADLDGMLVINSNDPDESALNVPVHVDCPTVPTAQILAWRSVRTHGVSTPLGIALDSAASGNGQSGPTVEPRSGGIQRIEVDFNVSVSLLNTAGITIIGRTTTGGALGGPTPYVPTSIGLADADTLAISFNPGVLPDQTCYTITLPIDVVTAALAGDRDVMTRALEGDATGSGDITLSDPILVKVRSGPAAANPHLDLDRSGTINAADVQIAKARVASPALKALCP